MCLPAAIGAALLVGGTGLKYLGEKKAQRAQSRAEEAERARQADLSNQQQAAFADSLSRAGAVADPAEMSRAREARESRLVEAITAPSRADYLPGAGSAPQIVATEQARAQGQQQADSRGLAAALAAMGGTDDQLFELGIGMGRNAQTIGQRARDKGNSANILQSELRAAAQKGALLRGIGSLAQTVGSGSLTAGTPGVPSILTERPGPIVNVKPLDLARFYGPGG